MTMPSHTARRHSRTSAERRVGSILAFCAGLLPLVTLSALPFFVGGRSSLGWGLAGLLIVSAVLCWALSVVCVGRVHIIKAQGVLIFFVLLGMGILQLSPTISAWFMPIAIADMWTQAGSVLHEILPARLALLPLFHESGLLVILEAGIFFWLLCQLFVSQKSILLLTCVVLLTVAVNVVLGVHHYISGEDWLLWTHTGRVSSASAAYANKNHFAMLQEFGLFTALGLAVALIRGGSHSSLGRLLGKWRSLVTVSAFVCAVLSLLALFLSYSRAGIFCAGAGLLLFTLYVFYRGKGLSTPFLMACIVMSALALVAVYGLDTLFARLDMALSGEDVSGLVRWEIWGTGIKVLAMAPWTGIGLGAFRYVSPMFEPSYSPGTISFNVHNDFLELAVSFGLPCAILVLALMAWRTWQTCALLFSNTQSAWHYLGMGCMTGLFVVLGHECFEYGLQQPANLLMFCAVSVIAGQCARLLAERNREATPIWRLGRALYVMPCLLALLLCIPAQTFALYADTGMTELHVQELSTASALPVRERQNAVLRQTAQALRILPSHFAMLDARATVARQQGYTLLAEYLAEQLSEMMGRVVSEERVWNAVYRPFLAQALEAFTPYQRNTIVACFQLSVDCYKEILRQAPSNALAMIYLAQAEDEVQRWSGTSTIHVLSFAEKALKAYPYNGDISRIATELYWRQMQTLPMASAERQTAQKHFWKCLRAALEQQPNTSRSLLNFAWNEEPSRSFIEELTPKTISSQEALYWLLRENNDWQGALAALKRLEGLNEARLDVETPNTLGVRAFLFRERREKDMLTLRFAEYALPVYTALHDTEALKKAEQRVRALRQSANTATLLAIDALLGQGQYMIAEQKLKKLGDDPRALIRYAEIARNAQRMELYTRLLKSLKAQQDLLTAEEQKALQNLCKALPEGIL